MRTNLVLDKTSDISVNENSTQVGLVIYFPGAQIAIWSEDKSIDGLRSLFIEAVSQLDRRAKKCDNSFNVI